MTARAVTVIDGDVVITGSITNTTTIGTDDLQGGGDNNRCYK